MAESGSGQVRSIGSRLSPRLREHNLTLVAAGVAFYAFLAFVPALIAFMATNTRAGGRRPADT